MHLEAYSALATLYDALADDYDYARWSAFYINELEKEGIKSGAYIADAACGTGNMAIPLKKKGFDVIGFDKSVEMLEVAADKMRKEGLAFPLARMELASFALPRKADAVVCSCDGVNYLTKNEEAEAFFSHAFDSLKSGGLLMFDISSAYKLQHILGNELFAEERDDISYIWSNNFVDKCCLLKMDITFFIRQPNGLFKREIELHEQRAYKKEEVEAMLGASGFKLKGIYGGLSAKPPKEDSLRIHFVAQKPYNA